MKTKENIKDKKTKSKKKIYIPPEIVENDVIIADAALPSPSPSPAPLMPAPAPRGPIAPFSPAPSPLSRY